MSPVSKSNQKGLGRGIDVLLPQDFDKSLMLDESERIVKVDIDLIEPNPDQPRKSFDKQELAQLADSIKQHGILQPLIVTPSKIPNNYTIIAGERRWRASKIANLKKLPVIVRSAQELLQLEIAMVENVQRVDLSPIEQANAILRLQQQFNLSLNEVSIRIGRNASTLANILRLLKLPPKARKALEEKRITEGHSRSILALVDDPIKQDELLDAIVRYGWSVRQAERFVVAYKKGAADKKAVIAKVKTESPETRRLTKHLSAPVSVRRMANGGKLEIGFTDEEDLARIVRSLLKK